MAEREANLPVDYFEVGPEDEQLTSVELGTLSLLEGLKKVPTFYKFPGSTVLRKCVPGQIMCRQGAAGASAFYILSAHDVVTLRQLQLGYVEAALRAGETAAGIPARFKQLAPAKLKQLKSEIEAEIQSFGARHAALEQAADDAERDRLATVAKVKLLVSLNPDRPRRGLLHRLQSWWRKSAAREESPAFIHIDGMMSLDTRTLEAPLTETEVFGEMSCLNRAPRSATVVVEQHCYMLEFLRNVLDMLYKDPQYKLRMDTIYRQRVLENQVRQLSVFKDLSDAEFKDLQSRLELVEIGAGDVIFDEHEESDCLYLIRSGLVKVVKHVSALISPAERARISWTSLSQELVQGEQSPQTLVGRIWSQMSVEIRELLKSALYGTELDPSAQIRIVAELNRFIREGHLLTAFGEKRDAVIGSLDQLAVEELIHEFPERVKDWSEQRSRQFHRALLEAAVPHGLPRRERRGSLTLRYLGKGEILGELGLLNDQPRSASCLAFDQRDRGQEQLKQDLDASPSRVELVRLKRTDLAAISPNFRRSLEAATARRMQHLAENLPVHAAPVRALQSRSREFEALGLIQGQRLMLIDLEKCTRCGACVEACVDAHGDGRNRLYLDGPRFDKYLVPVTCRSCLDPVCMIGCPVGAISRGDSGEIRIRNHCIGCELCADQCPYGSIHMSERELADEQPSGLFQLETGVVLKEFTQKAVVCDMCSSLASRDPSCVYACPHDAALRVDSREFFGVAE